ncbi:MAG: putative toxin-antitoxin system toxin component, PIN family [Chloroflexi bacterium]|nr:putative toxin-antitoxin system toxin component, PIN family [Chloroflexota bacterium]MDL1885124.1 putative toxin-antitoxin system toxin component, PIN family [Anaerolineae bacterium CFX8]
MSETPKVVFDTQVFLRALINPRSACGRLIFEQNADYILYTAAQIDNEVIEVLGRSSIREKFPQITDRTVQLVKTVLDQAYRVTVKADDIELICRDPKDDIFLACAKLAQADYLVSEDKDLLVLQQHYSTKIVNVAAFLTMLETTSAN